MNHLAATPAAGDRARLETYLRRQGIECPPPVPLVRDAGERMYFRLEREDGDPVVVCLMGSPYAPGALPFANSTRLYRELGVAVPEILDEAPDLGVVLLEDLGDDLLQHRALRWTPEVARLYGEAIEILVRIQREGERIGGLAERSTYRAYAMRLDAALFLRELRFFREHFLEERVEGGFSESVASSLERFFASLAEEAAGTPEALCHRDFHSRNLMVPGAGGLFVIDHQDTRIGPRTYDAVSLAHDPYVHPEGGSAPFVAEEMLARFRDAVGISENQKEFDAVALQRTLKALGTYGYQVSARKNPVYARYIAPTLATARGILDRPCKVAGRGELLRILADLAE